MHSCRLSASNICEVRIILEGKEYASVDFKATQWMQSAEIIIDNHVSGEIQVCYIRKYLKKEWYFYLKSKSC